MFKLNISTQACMQASLPISLDVAEYLKTRLQNAEVKRDELLKTIGYPVGVGSNSGFLNSVYNFANAILTESKAESFRVQIEAIPAQQKLNVFKGKDEKPDDGRMVVVFFADQTIEADVIYCTACKEWHSVKGNLKQNNIHQWVYADDFYNLLKFAEFPQAKTNKDEVPEKLVKLLLLKTLLSAATSSSDGSHIKFH
ncbi:MULTISPECIES: hypothetical protein [Acinetobacter calcoaceticus/baumannii complex]|uniref:Uncharacterized protein n=1 Tax=Acinetobacter pittii TaxID=48296 RepID=A0A4Y3JA60_ACIPI|nr:MULTISPECIES: hypothetical protein [Acinetobacter calcoaceticus/baumannii complex]EME5683327.1 hypothetical protein [Acinetobacter baumannii]MBF6881869.1 hypothetical protein [Acinetobacter baumannii]MCL8259719.1 hypothetical protein [Acinetobacter baumannii]OIG56687.1 hypothetical protein A7M54_12510 [Acinetobacter nosocomialis]OIG57003.1 hypothetical protein A7M62_09090 [Acinetobacter nosocomialis]